MKSNRSRVRVETQIIERRVVVITKRDGTRVFGSLCILVVGCPACRAKKGAPCTTKNGPMGDTHYERRQAATRVRERARAARAGRGERVKRTRPYRHPA